MLARRVLCGNVALPSLGSRVLGANSMQGGADTMQTREVASLKALKARMRAVDNMKKITKAMKMVAAAKLKHDERRMELSIPFVKPVKDLFGRLPRGDTSGALTYFSVTSDKGLCGGVNTSVAKQTRLGLVDEEAKGNAVKVMCIGGKGVSALKRNFGDRFTYTFEEAAKKPWTYTTASILAEQIAVSDPQRLKVVSNEYKSVVAYDTVAHDAVTMHEAKTMDRAEWSKAMDVYSFEPALYEVWDDLHEFYYAAVVHGSYLESATCEQSSRMNAMESASKNAGEMLEKIGLIYNRARQAKITTELCEIISGAAAV